MYLEKMAKYIQDFVWDLNNPPEKFINYLYEKTKNRIVVYEVEIIWSAGKFKNALMVWYNTHNNEKNWVDFKKYLSRSVKNLFNTRGNSMKNTIFEQVNFQHMKY